VPARAVRRHVLRRYDFLTERIRAGQQAGKIPAALDPARGAALVGLLLHGFAESAAEVSPAELEDRLELFRQLIDGELEPGPAEP
jgi:hypothetical protein